MNYIRNQLKDSFRLSGRFPEEMAAASRAPEPFASFPELALYALPNVPKGVPGVQFARDARTAAQEAAASQESADLLNPCPPFPHPWPARCQSPHTRHLPLGSPEHNLASAYWAYGWCESIIQQLFQRLSNDIRDPALTKVKEAFWTFKFPDEEYRTWDPRMGGRRPLKSYDYNRVVAEPHVLYAVPKWREWFAAYVRNGCQSPTCFWPHNIVTKG